MLNNALLHTSIHLPLMQHDSTICQQCDLHLLSTLQLWQQNIIIVKIQRKILTPQCLKISPKMSHLNFLPIWPKLTFFGIFNELLSTCKRSSLRSQSWMRLFLWFSNTVLDLVMRWTGPLNCTFPAVYFVWRAHQALFEI